MFRIFVEKAEERVCEALLTEFALERMLLLVPGENFPMSSNMLGEISLADKPSVTFRTLESSSYHSDIFFQIFDKVIFYY